MPRSRARGSRQFGGRRVRSRTPPKSRPRHTRRSSIRARASSRQGRPTYPLRPGGRDRRGRESSRRRRACQRGHLPGVARARPCGRDRRRDGSDSICQLETPARRAAHPDPRSRHRLRLAASRRRGGSVPLCTGRAPPHHQVRRRARIAPRLLRTAAVRCGIGARVHRTDRELRAPPAFPACTSHR